MIKIWVDDWRAAPSLEWTWCKSVVETKAFLLQCMKAPEFKNETVLLDLDHDAGDYQDFGGDFICILDWLEEGEIDCSNFRFRIHSMNPAGAQNMRTIIEHNKWKEIK